MRAIVTGGLGFVGSYVVHELLEQDPALEVLVIDKHNYASSVRNLRGVSHLPNVRLQCIDLADERKVGELVAAFRPEVVYHLAAETHVDRSFGNSIAFTHSNVVGTHNLLEACRKLDLGGDFLFVHMSTDEVYGAGEGLARDEGHAAETSILMPTNPYSASKAAAEMQVHAYKKSFGMPAIIVRCNNVYGPKQFCEKVVPRFILQALHNAPCTIHGSGAQMRSFLHVRDAAKAVVFLARNMYTAAAHSAHPQIVNVGSTAELSIIDLARRVFGSAEMGPGRDEGEPPGMLHVGDRRFNDFRYPVQIDTIRKLGWSETVPFDEGLRETIRWYAEHAREWFLPEDIDTAVSCDGHFRPRPPLGIEKQDKVVMLVGSSGWIGPKVKREILKYGFQVVDAKFRLSDTASMWDEIVSEKPSQVVLCAGVTGRPNIDWCEANPLQTVAANLEGTVTLAQICSRLGVHLTNFATGCIYAGGPEQAFTELDPPNFLGSLYSRTKAHAEDIQTNAFGHSTLVFRLRMPIDVDIDHPRNLVAKLRNYTRLVDHPNSVSVLSELLPVACTLLLERTTGIYNLTNPGHITPAQIMQLFDEYFPDEAGEWTAVSPQSLLDSGAVVAARSNCVLDCSRLLAAAHPAQPNPSQLAVRKVFEHVRRHRAVQG